MTVLKVVDASAVAALLFGEPEAEAIADTLQGTRLAAPALLPFEIANVCLVKIRRAPALQTLLLEALSLLESLSVELAAVDPLAVVETAQAAGLTAYDDAYLWLARRLGADLVTLDRKLASAFQQA